LKNENLLESLSAPLREKVVPFLTRLWLPGAPIAFTCGQSCLTQRCKSLPSFWSKRGEPSSGQPHSRTVLSLLLVPRARLGWLCEW